MGALRREPCEQANSRPWPSRAQCVFDVSCLALRKEASAATGLKRWFLLLLFEAGQGPRAGRPRPQGQVWDMPGLAGVLRKDHLSVLGASNKAGR